MTPEQMDALFPDRRAECQRAGLNPDVAIIPTACLKRLTDMQRNALFPAWREVLTDIRADVLAQQIANDAGESGDNGAG